MKTTIPTRFAVGALAAVALLQPALASPQTPQDLAGTDVEGGISIHEDLYAYVAAEIAAQNTGQVFAEKVGVLPPSTAPDGFEDLTEEVDSALGAIADAFNALTEDPLDVLSLFCSTFPEVCANPWGAAALAVITLACQGSSFEMSLEAPKDSAHGGFTVHSVSFDAQQGQHVLDVTLKDVGMLFRMDLTVSIGGNCDLYDDEFKGRFVFDELDYRVVVDLTSTVPTVTATLLTNLSGAGTTFAIDGFSVGGSFIAEVFSIISTDPIPMMETWASVRVTEDLQQIVESWWLPYLPTQNGLLNVAATQQVANYGSNLVGGTIDPPIFLTLGTNADGSRVRARFQQTHSDVVADAQAADAMVTFTPSAAEVDFSQEAADATGTFYLNSSSIQHVAKAGVVSAVGLRADDKDSGANPLIVEYGMDLFAPEHAARLVRTLIEPDPMIPSPIAPVPISLAQAQQLDQIPCSTCTTSTVLGDAALHALTLEIEVSEIDRDYEFFPFGGFAAQGLPDYALAWHDVNLTARLVSGEETWVEETFRAYFGTRIRLVHDRENGRHELAGVQTVLLNLVNGAGLEWFQIVGDVAGEPAAAQAPISLLMRAIFGLRADNADQADDHFKCMIEGLAGPLVERSVQGFVRLPGLDFPAFNGVAFGNSATASATLPGCPIGLDLSIPYQCARFDRWGVRSGQDATGAPNGTIFAVEVDWSPVGPPQPVNMQTRVTVQAVPSSIVGSFPSFEDKGYVKFTYSPSAAGDLSRVQNATGYRTGPYLEGGGRHYVAATPFGYSQLRADDSILFEIGSSIALVPYRELTDPSGCPLALSNPVKNGSDDEGTPFEVWTFESTLSCQDEACDGTRVGLFWGAPLFQGCGSIEEKAFFDFELDVRTVRGGADDYVVQTEPGCSSSGTGPGIPGVGGPID